MTRLQVRLDMRTNNETPRNQYNSEGGKSNTRKTGEKGNLSEENGF